MVGSIVAITIVGVTSAIIERMCPDEDTKEYVRLTGNCIAGTIVIITVVKFIKSLKSVL